jgi:hypothetical protein
MGKKMFIIWRIGRRKIAPNANMDGMHVYDMCHNPNLGLTTKVRAYKGAGQQ